MTVEVCLRIVCVIASCWYTIDLERQGEGYLSPFFVLKDFNCVSCIDQVVVSMAPHEQVISAKQTREGLLGRGPDRAIVWSSCSYGQGMVINTSAKHQAVWPICFLLGGRGKQWGGVLYTVGDWHYLLERSVVAFLLLRYSPQAWPSHFTSVGPRLSCRFFTFWLVVGLIICSWLIKLIQFSIKCNYM